MKDSLETTLADKIVTISAKTIEFFQSKSATVLAVSYLTHKNISINSLWTANFGLEIYI